MCCHLLASPADSSSPAHPSLTSPPTRNCKKSFWKFSYVKIEFHLQYLKSKSLEEKFHCSLANFKKSKLINFTFYGKGILKLVIYNPYYYYFLNIYLFYLIAVETDKDAASSTGPVVIEERRLANVTHLPHASHRRLPSDVLRLRLRVRVKRQTLPFLPHHIAKLEIKKLLNILHK